MGEEVLDRLGVDIGDTLEVAGDGNGQALQVVGSYVQAGENDPGSGALLTPEGFTTLEGEDRDSGVLVRFARDVDSDAALARLRELGDQVEVTRAGDAMPSNIDNVDSSAPCRPCWRRSWPCSPPSLRPRCLDHPATAP